ncbi:hypothetical protein lerEdw1_019199, partial [Lerista edwardsae]
MIGNQDSSPLPLPPPKESFSKFYQQRQVNELKRLYRHMHPELRKNLEEAVTEDLAEMLSTEDASVQASANLDPVLPGEVQSMRWIFENWTLDSIGEHQATKKLAEEETIPSGDVKNRSMRFESQPELSASTRVSEKEQTKGDVHTARWLFETQPLDSLNKMYLDETDLQEAVLKEPVQRGDVKGATQLFETHSLDTLGRCSSVEEQSILQLKSEIQEMRGNVKKTVKLFQTEPLCALRDKTGNIHEIKSICREEIQSNAVKTARWLFETQPLDTINRDPSKVQVIRGISLEEVAKGNVSGARWMFETQPLDAIRELTIEEVDFQASPDLIQGADVSKQCLIFETQPLDTLKGEAPDSIPAKEEVVKGDVKSTLWLFETQPMETLKDNFEVGHLKKVELLEEEKGAVKERKHVFETCPLGSIAKPPSEGFSATNVQEGEKGDVKAFKSLFETLPLDSIRQMSTEAATTEGEQILPGNLKANPLYAIKDHFGNYHKVTSVSREEEVTGGDVKNCKWMFETKPLDQFDGSVQKVDIIKGITKQEVVAGDVKAAKWLFETQPVDVIHNQVNQVEQNTAEKGEGSQGGDVKTCRWLFETHPMDALYEKDEKKLDREEPMPQADVKSCTWMFETQPLDSLKGQEEQYLQVSKAFCQDELQGVDVKTVRHLFETEPLTNKSVNEADLKKIIRCSSHVEIQSGEVSRVKEFFEAKPLDSTGKPSKTMKETDASADENIEPGAVHKFTWLFENCPMDTLKSSTHGLQEIPLEKDIQGGDVGGKRFVFETYSLGQIHDKENEVQIEKIQEETMNKANVKFCTMLFETQPLYAIQDKDGGYHEVTSVKKEEIMKGDVKGARWQFETKPLDQIKKDDEVFILRAVTQEDFKKGDVQAARWRFETEPLDSIAEDKRPFLRTVDDVQRGEVHSNKQLFESEQFGQKKYVRMVSVSDVQQGDVRTSTWLFENQPIDSLKGEPESTSTLTTVQREDIQKGDVKRCTWLFETQPMDTLKDPEEFASTEPSEEIPPANVKSTTWLFESTPLDKLSAAQHCTETEVREKTTQGTLEVLCSQQVIQHGGILIEASDAESVKMAKYQLGSQGTPEIQKEELIGGNLQRILLQLLQRTNVEAQGVMVEEEANGSIKVSPVQLLDPSKAETSQEDLSVDVAKALQGLLSHDGSIKKGIVVQEAGVGLARVTIYSLLRCTAQQQECVKGDVKSTIGNLLASSQEQKATATIRREDNERGNVQLYTSCIEKGDLDYLKNLHRESEIESLVSSQAKEELLKTVQEVTVPAPLQEEKTETVADVVLEDSKGAKRLLCEGKEGVLGGEVVHANHLGAPGCCLPPVTMKEKVVSGNVNLPVQSVQKAQNGSHRAVRAEMILGGREEGTASTQVTAQKDEVDGTIRCSPVKVINQTTARPQTQVLGSDLQAAMQDLRLATAEAKSLQHQVQNKLQKTSEETRLTIKQSQASTVMPVTHKEGCGATKQQQQSSSVAIIRVQETSKSCAKVSQKSVASHTKVSASEEGQRGVLPLAACPDCPVGPSAEGSIKDGLYTATPVRAYVNPFIESDYREHSVPEEREQDAIIRGDVKTAIRALQSAAAEQRQVEKEDVVRGNLKATLESLEKSNVNISKGDFKAAMIYRNAGQSSSSCKKKNEAQSVCNQEAVVASNSQAINDFPPPPPASVMRTECYSPSIKLGDVDTVGCPPPMQSHVPKTDAPAPGKLSDQRTLKKPQLPPKPDVIAPPRKKPAPPPKPDFLLQDALSHPTGGNKGQSLRATPPPLSSKPPCVSEQNKPKNSPLEQSRPSCGIEAWEPSTHGHDLLGCPASPSCVAMTEENMSSRGKAIKDIVKTPLQVAEERYKAMKEEQSKLEMAGHRTSSEEIKNGLVGCKEEMRHPMEGFQGFLNSCQQENGCTLPAQQTSLLPLGCQTGVSNLEGERKPYISAKCHANTLRKGTVMTHASKTESTGTPEASDSKAHQQTHLRMEREVSEAAISAPSSLQSQQFFKGHQFVNSRGLEEPETKAGKHVEEEKPVVVMREKCCRETEDERRKRLSVHKEEIMKGNVKEAMEIFENFRRQEELQEILTRVKEFEEETSKVDVKALRSFFENVPEWVVRHKTNQMKQTKVEKAEHMKEVKEDTDSVSSVELAFEDLERASTEIIHLKEQTLSKLLDIEEAIRKALYSISNLKSESDIAGLSGLIKESLESPQSLVASNSVPKTNTGSSKTIQERGIQNSSWSDGKVAEKCERPKTELEVPYIVQPRASSPSYISIQSAARKSTELPKMVHSCSSNYTDLANVEKETFAQDIFSSLPRKTVRSDGYDLAFCEGEPEHIQMKKGANLIKQQRCSPEQLQHQVSANTDEEQEASQTLIPGGGLSACKAPPSALSPSNPRRQKSILELQTSHDGSKLYGATRTVMEEYEEVDEFGNKIITSSTTVTKQSETQTSTTCDMSSCPTRYEVTASPILRRYLNSPAEHFHSNGGLQEAGVVFVTFGNSKPAKNHFLKENNRYIELYFLKTTTYNGLQVAAEKEECAFCSKPVYSAERMVIQNVPLHRACFYCKSCGRKLSLLNYTTFRGEFYCKVHYGLLADTKERIQEQNVTIQQSHQPPPTARLPSSESETKTRSNNTGKVPMREKMHPRLSSSQPRAGLRSPKPTRQLDSQNRFSWPLLKEAANGDVGKTLNKTRKKVLQETVLILHTQGRAEQTTKKALEDKALAEAVHLAKKQSQLPRVRVPTRAEPVSQWIKSVGGNRDGGILKKRVSFMERSIPGVQPRKGGQTVSERTAMFEHDMLKLARRLPTASPLRSILAKPSSVGSFPSPSEAPGDPQVSHFAATSIGVPCLAKASFETKELIKSSSSKDVSDDRGGRRNFQRAGPLLKLPRLTSPEDRPKEIPDHSKSKVLIAPTREEAEQFSCGNTEAKCELGDQKPSQANPEAPGYPTEHEDERNRKATELAEKVASSPDSVETTDRISGHSWVCRNTFPGMQTYPKNLQRFGLHLRAETHTKLTEMKLEEKTQPGRKLEVFDAPPSATDQAVQDTEPEGKPISFAAERDVGQTISSLEAAADTENMNIPSRNSPLDTIRTHNVTPSANDNAGPVGLSVRNTTTNVELPEKASGENNIQLPSQENSFGRTVLQAPILQLIEPEPVHSTGPSSLANTNTAENAARKQHRDDGAAVQAAQRKTTTKDSARKPPLKREPNALAGFLATKIQVGAPKQEPAKIQKAPKAQSALATLFGSSWDKGTNPKEQPGKTGTNPSVETREERGRFAVCLKSSASKEVGTLAAEVGSEAALQDSENLRSQPGEGKGQRESSSQRAEGYSA